MCPICGISLEALATALAAKRILHKTFKDPATNNVVLLTNEIGATGTKTDKEPPKGQKRVLGHLIGPSKYGL